MTRLGIAATLGLLIIQAGCAGVHRKTGHHPITEDWEIHDPAVHSTKDPFVPQTSPGLSLGMARYFPGLNRLTTTPEPTEGPGPVAETDASRPRLGFRLFRMWAKPDHAPAGIADPTDPDQLARRSRSEGGSPPSGPAMASATGNQPPRLPIAMLAEVDPAILPAAGPAIADLSEARPAPHHRDTRARRVQARPDDVADTPAPQPIDSDSGPVADPFAGFDLPGSPPSLAERTGRHQTEPIAEETAAPEPVAAVTTTPEPVASGIDAAATNPSDPFAGFDPPTVPAGPDLFVEAEDPVPARTEPAPARHRERYGHTTLPISRRYNPTPLEPERRTVAEDESAERPQMPLVRPWKGRKPEASGMLPPATFPPSYYNDGAQVRPAAARQEEPRARRHWFQGARLFHRLRGESEPPTDPADLTGVEPDHVPESR